MDDLTLDEALAELSSAEDFLDFFGVAYDPAVVRVNRLHILQRFHDYLAQAAMPADDADRRALHAHWLARAYQDFVLSDALTEKVFKVFHMHEPQTAFVPLSAITVQRQAPAPLGSGGCGCGGSGVCHSSEAALRAP